MTLGFAAETKGLSRRYGRSWALVQIDVQIPEARALLLAGRNGSGKSTLLGVLSGALRADQGSVTVNGCDTRLDRTGVRRATALLGHASYLYEPLSALENLRIAAAMLGRPETVAQLMTRLEQVGLEKRAHDPVANFSAGMKKRVSIARLRLQQPRLMLLDEPYAALDPQGFLMIDALVRESVAAGTAVIVASHDLARTAPMCQDGMILTAGRVTFRGTAAEVVHRPELSGAAEGAA